MLYFVLLKDGSIIAPTKWMCTLLLTLTRQALAGIIYFQNRKNDEASYEKMLKLRRDLNRAL